MDPELRRVLEESMRTYQQEMGQTGAEAKQDAGEGAEESNASEPARDIREHGGGGRLRRGGGYCALVGT